LAPGKIAKPLLHRNKSLAKPARRSEKPLARLTID